MILIRYCFVCLIVTALMGCGSDTSSPKSQSPQSTELQSQTPSQTTEDGTTTSDQTIEDRDRNGDEVSLDEQVGTDETVIVFFGDSITAGYGIDRKDAFPALIEDRFNANGHSVIVRNAGVSGETTAGGLRRIDWVLNQHIDVIVVELGGNDGLRGIPVAETEANLKSIIERIRSKYPDASVVVAGMQLPPNLGESYTAEFAGVFSKVASEEDATLIPFILEGVGGNAELNQSDGIHPTARGHRVIAEHIWPTMLSVVERVTE